MKSTVLVLSLLATLAQIAHSQASDPSECELILFNCPGGLGDPNCLHDYCNGPAGSCAPHCCSLPTTQEIEQCLGGGSPGGGSVPSSNPQCSSLNGFIKACETLTPSFTFLAPSAQATCLCYDDQGNFMPDSFDQAALGCYQWAAASDSAYAGAVSAHALGFCTNNAAAASSGALPTSGMTSGTFASKVVASSSAVITGFSSTSSETAATKSGVEGAGGGTETALTSTTPTPTTAAKNPNSTPVSTQSSDACLWISPTYFSGIAILLAMLALTLS